MRILVIDDHTDTESALAGSLRDTDHVVVGARDPAVLPDLLAHEPPFDVATVDMGFPRSLMTGIGALRIMTDRAPDTRLIIRSAEEEENRLLLLVAAFSLFDPFAMGSKDESPERTMELLLAARDGRSIASGADRYRLEEAMHSTLDALIRNKTDLVLWRMLARFDKRADIASASFVAPRTVDHFIEDMYPVVDQLQLRFGVAAQVSSPGGDHPRHAGLIRLTVFARTHQMFFNDPDLEPLLTERWQGRRKKLSDSSAAVRRTRPRTIRRPRPPA
jgi:DNA-binding NarL/FixJ family response regulator